jgi:tRNA (guanine26-N2/guanine27-N2)-dimethyltransferase
MLARALRWSRGCLAQSSVETAPPGVTPLGHEELVEGLARVIFRKGDVFYNPAQVVNRDLSVLVLRWLQRERSASSGGPTAGLRVLEALSATGLRSIRYATEVPGVARVLANDLDPAAAATIARNIAYNGPDVGKIVVPNCGDAVSVMTAARAPEDRYDVVDLDPYGGAAPFLDSAVQAVVDGGLLCVTCTDLAVLCGNSPEACFARYGATPLKGPAGHELAIRIVLFAINAAANRHGRSVEVVFCAKIDFYVRLFVRIRDSKATAKLSHASTSMVLQCTSCGTQRFQVLGRAKHNLESNTRKKKRKEAANESAINGVNSADGGEENEGSAAIRDTAAEQTERPQGGGIVKFAPALVADGLGPRCTVCRGTVMLGGPIWAGPLVDADACTSILKEIASGAGAFKARDRVDALVRVSQEEIRDAPLFMQLNNMCKVLRCTAPPSAALRTCLESKGYPASQSHTDPQALKTAAPPDMIWDILRIWAQKAKPKARQASAKIEILANGCSDGPGSRPETAGERILNVEPTTIQPDEVDFSIKKDKFVRRGTAGPNHAPRFLPNPEPHWGPKARAGTGKRKREEDERCMDSCRKK